MVLMVLVVLVVLMVLREGGRRGRWREGRR